MSLILPLEVPNLSWDQAEMIASACSGPGKLRVRTGDRRRLLRPQPPSLWVDDADEMGRSLLAEDADWDEPSWKMDPDVLPLLAATIECLCAHLPQGFALSAIWFGDELRGRRDVSCEELLLIVRNSSMNPHTQYRVRC